MLLLSSRWKCKLDFWSKHVTRFNGFSCFAWRRPLLVYFFAVHRLEDPFSLLLSLLFSVSPWFTPFCVVCRRNVNINISVSRPSSFCALCIFPSECRVVFLLKFPLSPALLSRFPVFLFFPALGKEKGLEKLFTAFSFDLHFRLAAENRIIFKILH